MPTRPIGIAGAVEWLKDVPRVQLSQGALHEIDSTMTFFAVRSYADEHREIVEGKALSTPVAQDTSATAVSEVSQSLFRKNRSAG
jgi:predicted Mrr-cat superfamily restriction endonuclease